MPRCPCAIPAAGPPRGSPRRRSTGFRTTLDAHGFIEIHTPKVVASATEGGANVFPIDWFGRTAFLAQSPQFYKQTMVGVFERVYEVGPVFRAEPHDTARHLAEYVSLDAEMGFITDHTDVMAVLRAVIAGDGRRPSPSAPRPTWPSSGCSSRPFPPRSRRSTSTTPNS